MKKILLQLAIMSALLFSCEEPHEYTLSISPNELTFESKGGELSVTVISSNSWSLAPNYYSEWCRVSARTGESGDVVTFSAVSPNTYNTDRQCIWTFYCGDISVDFLVVQKAEDSRIIQFKDPYFLEALVNPESIYLNGHYYLFEVDQNDDGQISENEAASVKIINLNGAGIRNVDELRYFTDLMSLYCRNNELTSLDLSNNTALTYLDCYNNQLTSLDLSNNTALTYLDCGSNQLTSLDVSNNTALEDLSCSNNQLTSLDVSNNTALEDLSCSNNQLTSLDVSNNTALTDLDCYYSQLTSLDVSNNTALTGLNCSDNQLTSLDISNNTALTSLNCYYNQLTSLDVSNNTALTDLDCGSNQLTSLDVHNNRGLEYLRCAYNPLLKLIIYKYHVIDNWSDIESQYGDIIEYME